MESKKCQFCEHSNPADSKYCSECGGCLYLLPCPHCGAVTDITTATCYQCHGQLQGGRTDAADAPQAATAVATEVTTDVAIDFAKPDARYSLSTVNGMSKFDALASALPIAETTRSHSVLQTRLNARPNARVAASVALLVVIAALGYYVYHQRFVVNNTPKPPVTGVEARSGAPSSTGVIRSEAPSAGAAAGNSGAAAVPLAGATSAAAAVSAEAKAIAAPAAGKLATEGSKASERGTAATAASAACAPGVAALGLCAATPAQTKEAEADAVLNAANARPPGAGAAALTETRQQACLQVSAALGLCAPTSAGPAVPAVTHTQRKE